MAGEGLSSEKKIFEAMRRKQLNAIKPVLSLADQIKSQRIMRREDWSIFTLISYFLFDMLCWVVLKDLVFLFVFW